MNNRAYKGAASRPRSRAPALAATLALPLLFALGCDPPPAAPPPTGPPPPPCPAAQCVAMGMQALGLAQYPQATLYLDEACRRGVPSGCFELGNLYRQGNGVQRSPAHAANYYERACNAGMGEACTAGGLLCERGDPAVRDLNRSHALYNRGCSTGEVRSCFNAGMQAAGGQGCARDHEQAVALFEQSCGLGSATGCLNGGELLYRERGQQDSQNARATRMFGSACHLGEASGCIKLGLATLRGVGVPQSRVQARQLFQRACASGHDDGCHAVRTLDRERESSDGRDVVIALTSSVPSITINEMTLKELSCRLPTQGPWALAEVTESLASQKRALDACAPGGAATTVSWTFARKATKEITVHGERRTQQCVRKAMKKIRSGLEGTCSAVVLLGNRAGAERVYAARATTPSQSVAAGP
ncbi:MAG: SEL1-like repeat protein [Myxococcales bacterium]|nr:SEL1-like repeat protein [Myxococcales bacterium]MCB9751086.1 SEL1-like repeat protein [Myxococcales bacterium]